MRDDYDINTRLNSHNVFEHEGNYIHCFGGANVDDCKNITGMTAYGWYGNEISLQHANTIQECFNRCSGEGSFILWDTNPDYPGHPVKLNYIDKSGERLPSGDLRLKAWHFELEDNDFLPKDYIELIKASTPPGMWYDRKIKGLWVAAEGIVYEGFNRNVHVIEPFKPPADWMRYRAIDWGFTNPFCCLWGAVDHDGRLYIYHEHYKAQTLIEDHAKAINGFEEYLEKDGKQIKRISYVSTVADHDPQDNAEIKQHGIYTKNADKDKRIGIEKVAARLMVKEDGRPRLFITRDCVNTIREFGLYRWPDSKDIKNLTEEPLDKDNHSSDALRYMIMEIDGKRLSVPLYSAGSLGL